MKFKEYVAGLVKLLADRPETAEFGVVSASDDGGGVDAVCIN